MQSKLFLFSAFSTRILCAVQVFVAITKIASAVRLGAQAAYQLSCKTRRIMDKQPSMFHSQLAAPNCQ